MSVSNFPNPGGTLPSLHFTDGWETLKHREENLFSKGHTAEKAKECLNCDVMVPTDGHVFPSDAPDLPTADSGQGGLRDRGQTPDRPHTH